MSNLNRLSCINLDEIARRAYQLWEESGYRHGNDVQHWLEAERQIKAELSPPSDEQISAEPSAGDDLGIEVEILQDIQNPGIRITSRSADSDDAIARLENDGCCAGHEEPENQTPSVNDTGDGPSGC